MRPDSVDGVLVIDKPAGPTSHDIVQKVRRVVRTKVGHTGTLDPAATGVLVLVLGRATRLSAMLAGAEKEYLAQIRLGRVTDTDDADGEIIEEHPVPPLERAKIEAVLDRFRGTIRQVPPMFSAVKVGGEPLYRAARRRETRERPSREVTLSKLELVEMDAATLSVGVICSAGTYIRSLAHDIGTSLGCGAMLERLRRTRSGTFSIEQAFSLEDLADRWQDGLIPLSDLLPDIPERSMSLEEARSAVHGNPIRDPDFQPDREGAVCRLTYAGKLVAIAAYEEGVYRPKIVLRPDLPL